MYLVHFVDNLHVYTTSIDDFRWGKRCPNSMLCTTFAHYILSYMLNIEHIYQYKYGEAELFLFALEYTIIIIHGTLAKNLQIMDGRQLNT